MGDSESLGAVGRRAQPIPPLALRLRLGRPAVSGARRCRAAPVPAANSIVGFNSRAALRRIRAPEQTDQDFSGARERVEQRCEEGAGPRGRRARRIDTPSTGGGRQEGRAKSGGFVGGARAPGVLVTRGARPRDGLDGLPRGGRGVLVSWLQLVHSCAGYAAAHACKHPGVFPKLSRKLAKSLRVWLR